MSMRFRWLSGGLVLLISCLLLAGCANSSRNISSTSNLYVAATGSSQIWGFRANFFTGALSLINGAPFAFPSSGHPQFIVVDPSKNFAYVSVVSPSEIQTFAIDANGSFAPGSQAPVTLSAPITAMILDST